MWILQKCFARYSSSTKSHCIKCRRENLIAILARLHQSGSAWMTYIAMIAWWKSSPPSRYILWNLTLATFQNLMQLVKSLSYSGYWQSWQRVSIVRVDRVHQQTRKTKIINNNGVKNSIEHVQGVKSALKCADILRFWHLVMIFTCSLMAIS